MSTDTAPSRTGIDLDVSLNQILTDFFNQKIVQARQVDGSYETLWKELARVTLNGGKRLRPKMTVLAYEAFGGQDTDAILKVAAAQEILHSSLLIHDDIIDRETVRRGHRNVTGEYDQTHYHALTDPVERRHYSDSAALLGGDLLLASALELFRQSPAEPALLSSAEVVLHRMIFEVAGGQLFDMEAAFSDLVSAETIARYKTASYSFIGPLLCGAILADAAPGSLEPLREYAISLGIAFQLSDDLLGSFGNESDTGKSTDSDLREGKKTYIIERFREQASADDEIVFEAVFGNTDASTDDFKRLKRLIISSGAVTETERRITDLADRAATALDSLALPPDAHAKFMALIKGSTKRRS